MLRYLAPIATTTPARYRFISRRGVAMSPTAAVDEYFNTIKPAFALTSSIGASSKFPFSNAEKYGSERSSQGAGPDTGQVEAAACVRGTTQLAAL